jgi:hypothetical protein
VFIFNNDGGGGIFGRVFFYHNNGYVFIILSNMGLCVSENLSFICNLCKLNLYMWNRPIVLSNLHFFNIFFVSASKCTSCLPHVFEWTFISL